ncbi:CapA family protein [Bacillus benzoevorans]|uniref:Poly-gamma-glutamate synthesis protein (Capsule biosynthesis protein) n=1 Tax=Bacillus benzoevorans TaxID=1456 RepID=A0A7X0LWL2_9BACI|nr:CapA family protein [Bacillus benzoevorans]MBB6445484.1 poly-gamma-glutamate synthesis protein (capsule biosynthesis protein) [Bacillus benzoevorans]
MKKLNILFISFLAASIAGCSAEEAVSKSKLETTKIAAVKKAALTNAAVEEQSAQTAKILQKTAATGANLASQQDLTGLLEDLTHYELNNDKKGQYIENLIKSLRALESYSKGNADEKALGAVYPDYVSAAQNLKAETPELELNLPSQYEWFYAAAALYEQGRKRNGEITLTFVGDNSFGTYPETPEHLKFDNVFTANNGDHQYVFKNSLPWFNSDDYTIINAESAFTHEEKAVNKMWRIKSKPEHVAFLPASGVEAANLANNHTMDYFEIGYKDTLKAFSEHKVDVFNDGMPLVKTIGGIETVFLGYDCRMSQYSADYLARITEEVTRHKRPDNLVIVNMHWGVEYRETPVDYQTNFAHAILDAGADILMGSHPHRLESIENYNGKYIIYSMGDYAFGADPTLLSRQTAMFRIKFAQENGTVVMRGLTIVPTLENSDGSTTENDYQPLPVFGQEAADIMNELIRISTPIANGVTEYDYFDPFLDVK